MWKNNGEQPCQKLGLKGDIKKIISPSDNYNNDNNSNNNNNKTRVGGLNTLGLLGETCDITGCLLYRPIVLK